MVAGLRWGARGSRTQGGTGSGLCGPRWGYPWSVAWLPRRSLRVVGHLTIVCAALATACTSGSPQTCTTYDNQVWVTWTPDLELVGHDFQGPCELDELNGVDQESCFGGLFVTPTGDGTCRIELEFNNRGTHTATFQITGGGGAGCGSQYDPLTTAICFQGTDCPSECAPCCPRSSPGTVTIDAGTSGDSSPD